MSLTAKGGRFWRRDRALGISLFYALWGIGWIIGTDFVLTHVLSEQLGDGWIPHAIKGVGFVLVTALLLYWLIRHQLNDLQNSQKLLKEFADNIPDICWVASPTEPKLIFVNKAYERIFGLPREQVRTDPWAWIGAVVEEDRDHVRQQIASWAPDKVLVFDFRIHNAEGELRWLRFQSYPVLSDQGQVTSRVGIATDVTETRTKQAQLDYQATRDALTGLYNREVFTNRLEEQVMSSAAAGERFALFFIDLDSFKLINDEFGHETGDRAIQHAATVLNTAVGDHGLVARLGGDEFAVLLSRHGEVERWQQTAENILQAFRDNPYDSGIPVNLMASIGVALYPTLGDSAKSLLRNADLAMYQAKANGGGHWQLFDPANVPLMNAGHGQ
ncbi:diguanylate cyclase (GGDEF)-like protein/PAS domain S-box-containing protein [Methylohalomonas lacus]|uniref:Diguanylate cyclase (GGDEF)-like protein/PAS domain S-box-containing protein n=1 Tax=Methylohalomonas lacus TaxID=398773 RepID=A0AAE3L1P4_9GAMM|nr:sensor domain-containing diguanylate cyclase [Methylohalomonas lacus]MCS3903416.1 diguanylate cyclase (GGDEF)-like protein/PAS domain S-box-containing protein [Methylohalomonas lacus]